MAFDKQKEFEMIEKKLNEIRILCNRAEIPFIWVAAVRDDEEKTDYRVTLDENMDGTPLDPAKYACHALVPGSMEIKLKDDKIKDIVKVLNGFKVVAKDNPITINPEDFSYAKIFPKQESFYQYDEDTGGCAMSEVMCGEEDQSHLKKDETIYLDLFEINCLTRIEGEFDDLARKRKNLEE